MINQLISNMENTHTKTDAMSSSSSWVYIRYENYRLKGLAALFTFPEEIRERAVMLCQCLNVHAKKTEMFRGAKWYNL